MKLADLCIERPVLTLMMTLALVVFGVLGYERLGVDQYPNMEFPVVTVSAQLEGASPEVMEEDVTEVLEEHINTIGGLRSLRSTTFHGAAMIQAEFELERDIDEATQDVRDKVARARYELPPEMDPPVIEKVNIGAHPIVWIPVTSDRSLASITDYMRYTAKPYIETISGVASIELFGRRDRAIRIWLDGKSLRARGLSAADVMAAVQREHVDIPGGLVESRHVEYSLKTAAEFQTVEELANLIVAFSDGAPVRLRDVARVEDGEEDLRFLAHYNGELGAGMGIVKQARANTVAIADAVRKRTEELRRLAPEDIRIPDPEKVIDFSDSIREAVAETQFALVFGGALAILTVFVFLRRMRPTMVVSAAIPLSIIGTFGFMWIFGFTLNVMTLLALTLAVGVVIDDAIVVLENIERHREMGESPWDAASKGTREIAFAAMAATFSIAAVFLPVAAVEGIVGSFLREFGIVVAASVIVSLFVSLTLTPMLAARMPPPQPRRKGGVYDRLERGFVWLESHYAALIDWAVVNRGKMLAGTALSFAISIGFGSQLAGEFLPAADEGRIFMRMETPPGTSLEATAERVLLVEQWILRQPEVYSVFSGIGVSGPDSPPSVTNSVLIAALVSSDQRTRKAQEIMRAARADLGNIPGLHVSVIDPSTAFTSGGRGDFEFYLRGNVELADLDRVSEEFVHRLERIEGFEDLSKSLKLGLPEIRVIPDREKAADLGVDARSIAAVVQASIGGIDIATFKEAGHRYDVRMRLEPEFRTTPESIGELYVRARDGNVLELRNLVSIETGAAPSLITRQDRLRSVSISANLEGLPVSEAIQHAERIAREILPDDMTIVLAGSAEAFQESVSQFALAIGLAVLVIYMLLAAQFESLLHPLTVMLALPLAMVGALGGLLAMGMTLNLFSLIGIILLLGLVTKNSILLVDFANQLRETGLDKVEAMRRAAPVRMRPVLMTAISMIFGVLPAAIGVGPGSESRAPMAVATGAGMFSSTLLTLLVVPVFYLVLDDTWAWVRTRLSRGARAGAPSPGSRRSRSAPTDPSLPAPGAAPPSP